MRKRLVRAKYDTTLRRLRKRVLRAEDRLEGAEGHDLEHALERYCTAWVQYRHFVHGEEWADDDWAAMVAPPGSLAVNREMCEVMQEIVDGRHDRLHQGNLYEKCREYLTRWCAFKPTEGSPGAERDAEAAEAKE
jgi:hypothetical protein